jgi:hypothetical protein
MFTLKEKNIELPNKDYDRTIYAFMIEKYDPIENFFLINRTCVVSEKLRAFNFKIDENEILKVIIQSNCIINFFFL